MDMQYYEHPENKLEQLKELREHFNEIMDFWEKNIFILVMPKDLDWLNDKIEEIRFRFIGR